MGIKVAFGSVKVFFCCLNQRNVTEILKTMEWYILGDKDNGLVSDDDLLTFDRDEVG